MAYNNRFQVDPIRTIAFGGITNVYANVGAAITDPVRVFVLSNLTDVDVMFSLDGVNDHFIVPRNAFKLFDITANKVRDDGFFLADGTVFYVRDPTATVTTGNVHVEVIHA